MKDVVERREEGMWRLGNSKRRPQHGVLLQQTFLFDAAVCGGDRVWPKNSY